MRTFAEKPKATQKATSPRFTVPARSHLRHSHEVKSILHPQRTVGNQAVQRLLQSNAEERDSILTGATSPHVENDFGRIPMHPSAAGTIQTKLAINTPGDEYEQEADRVAERVMRIPEPKIQRPCACAGGCPKCNRERPGREAGFPTKLVQASDTEQTAAPPIVLDVLRSHGQPLDPMIRAFMEPRFGHGFSRVRVHSGAAAEQSAQQMNARAYTVGNNIVFGAGQLAPGTTEGKRLLAHELTHVMQQRGAMGEHLQRAPKIPPAVPAKALEPLEAVAQRIARLAVGPRSAAISQQIGGPGPVVSVVRNIRTGQLYVGLNTGRPADVTEPIEAAIAAQKKRIAAGEVKVVHTAADAVGGHAEVNALNRAIADEKAALGHVLTEKEIGSTFEMHNVWLSGKRKLTTAARCEHCSAITRGVRVTQSLFKAEGGVSGEIIVPQRGKAVKTGGKVVEADTVHGEIGGSKSPVKPPATGPAPGSGTTTGGTQGESTDTGGVVTSSRVSNKRVSADFEFDKASRKTTVKIQSINIADYPPDKQGSVSRFFNDRPVLAQLSIAGASMAVAYLKGKAFEKIKEHFESTLQHAHEEFELKFPGTKSLFAKAGVTQTRKAYNSTLATLRAPNRKRDLLLILAALSPPDQIEEAVRTAKRLGSTDKVRGNDIQNFLTASDAYVQAILSVQDTLYAYRENRPVLPTIANDLFARAAVLKSIGSDFDDIFRKMLPFAVFPGAEAELLDIYWGAELFKNLGARVFAFAAEVEQRHWEYLKLNDSLEREFRKVNREVLKWN